MPSARDLSLRRFSTEDSDSDAPDAAYRRRSSPLVGGSVVLGVLVLVAVVAFYDAGGDVSTVRSRSSGLGAPSSPAGLQDAPGEESCANYGCGYVKRKSCRCDSQCAAHKNCCSDYNDVCSHEASVSYKPESESWSFEKEVASRPLMLAEGVYYDPKAPPPLYQDGCESDAGWTNGFERAASSKLLNENLTKPGTSAAHANTLYTAEGFTCKAYAAGGWCSKPWALGPFSNYPERHCCACGGGTTITQLSAEKCGPPTGKCADDIKWAMESGIFQHPEWYPGLTGSSSQDEFQAHFASKQLSDCLAPCEAKGGHESKSGGDRSDKVAGCPRRAYFGSHWGPGFCFAQLASNSGVTGTRCGCRQGCDTSKTLIMSTNETVAFTNLKNMGWSTKTCSREVLLTIPREFYRDYWDLKAHCGREGMRIMVEVLMRDAWNAYNTKLCPSRMEPLWQCFHSPRIASVPYIHMQTFSANGYFHGMPTTNRNVGICVRQAKPEEAYELSHKLAAMM
eukprot:TRINITY_DN38955_c0_g1_i1.p1 TRINITY_DN38955_c0_g1~~TRINITY_DN38955_c0_g1_i1.p1  ORF type:complete len:524 (-),score=70.54 TRINITY_DN38955_c0_g1_i1:236-1759(-)